MPTDRIPTTVHLPAEVKAAAQRAADADGRSLSNWIERLILAATKRPRTPTEA